MATSEEQQHSGDGAAKHEVRPIADIQSDLDQTRQRLAENIAALKAEASPKALGRKAKARAEDIVVKPDGSLRTDRIAAAAGVLLALLLLRRTAKARSQRKELRRLAEVVWVPVPRSAVSPELAPMARNAKELAPLLEQAGPRLEITSS